MLPKMDGWEILARLRKTKKNSRANAHRARPDPRPRARPRHRRGRLSRQAVRLSELFARLRAIIRRSANKTTNVIEIGEVKIDTAARNVFSRTSRLN